MENEVFDDNSDDSDFEVDTLIGAKTEIVGDLRFHGTLHLEGLVDGKLEALDPKGAAVVRGEVRGQVFAPTVIVNGIVDGDIHASNRLRLEAGAVVTGNVRCRAIDMAIDARLNGKLLVDPGLIPPTLSKPKRSPKSGHAPNRR